MRAALLNGALDMLVSEAAKVSARSPQQKEMFEAGAATVVRYLQEGGLAETILPAVQNACARVEAVLKRAEAVSTELSGVAEVGDLPANVREVILLTRSVAASLVSAVRPESAHGSYIDLDTAARREVVRATSYIVWAFLTRGAPMPGPEEVAR
jgi:hypothetical protein